MNRHLTLTDLYRSLQSGVQLSEGKQLLLKTQLFIDICLGSHNRVMFWSRTMAKYAKIKITHNTVCCLELCEVPQKETGNIHID